MKRLISILTLVPAALCSLALADDVSGERHLLCSTLRSDICILDAECTKVIPQELSIPQFIRLDARTGKMSTTAASGLNRETTASSVTRDGGQLIFQGVEKGRAFSLFIHEASGDATFASAADGLSVTVFAACTPADGK